MRLQTLTNLDKNKIEDDRQAKIDLIAKLKEILEKMLGFWFLIKYRVH